MIKIPKPKKEYDLEERTAKFGEEIIKFSRTIKQDVINKPLISQLVRSATSIGANYMEANAASSKKDLIIISGHRMSLGHPMSQILSTKKRRKRQNIGSD